MPVSIKPVFLPVAPIPNRFFSIRATFMPISDSQKADSTPVIPPPIIQISTLDEACKESKCCSSLIPVDSGEFQYGFSDCVNFVLTIIALALFIDGAYGRENII